MTLEVTFNDHHLEHWGSRMRALEGQGNVGPGGGGRAPQGSTDSEEGQGKAGSGEHCGPASTEMLCAWQMRPALLPGLAVTL